MLQPRGYIIMDSMTNQDLEDVHTLYTQADYYVADVVELLTGERPYALGLSPEGISSVTNEVARDWARFQRIANAQLQRGERAYDRMKEVSQRQSEDPYAYRFLGEHKPSVMQDSDFEEVVKILRVGSDH